MTSIRDIPYEDIKVFLNANDETFGYKNEAYDLAFALLNNPKSKGHTTSIIEWIMAYNLLQNNVKIPIYSIYDIDNMPQEEINDLAKLLKMKRNNRENIKNILRYLHKLDEKIIINPDISSLIFPMLNQLEIKELQNLALAELRYNNVINLLKTHRNKKLIRSFIYSNLGKIIFYNIYNINFNDFKDFDPAHADEFMYDLLGYADIHNKDILIEIIIDNKEKLKKNYDNNEMHRLIENFRETPADMEEVYIGKYEIYDLIDFTFGLLDINEKALAKKVFDLANELHLFGRSYSYDIELIDYKMNDKNLITIIEWMGDDEFLKSFGELLDSGVDIGTIILFENLVKNKKYDLLMNTLELYDEYHPYGKIYSNIKEAILRKDDRRILKSLKSLKFES